VYRLLTDPIIPTLSVPDAERFVDAARKFLHHRKKGQVKNHEQEGKQVAQAATEAPAAQEQDGAAGEQVNSIIHRYFNEQLASGRCPIWPDDNGDGGTHRQRSQSPCDAERAIAAAAEYLAAQPGTVAGYGIARRKLYSLCNILRHRFQLHEEDALDLLEEWGQQESNTYANGRYYPWTRKELAASLRRACLFGKSKKKHPRINKWKEAQKTAEQLVERFSHRLPDRTHKTRSHPTGYLISKQQWIDYLTVILYVPRQEGDWNPCARHKAYFQCVEGFSHGWSHERYMTVRNFFIDVAVFACVVCRYQAPLGKAKGFCCRWYVDYTVVNMYLSPLQ
jgi:hypothetical protein